MASHVDPLDTLTLQTCVFCWRPASHLFKWEIWGWETTLGIGLGQKQTATVRILEGFCKRHSSDRWIEGRREQHYTLARARGPEKVKIFGDFC